jgi:hypothetical protein
MSWQRRLADAVMSSAETLERSQTLAHETAQLLSDADERLRTATERLVLAELVADDHRRPSTSSGSAKSLGHLFLRSSTRERLERP